MNKALIKNIIQFKLTTAEKILDRLPKEMSSNLRNLGALVLDNINEGTQQTKDETVSKTKSSVLNNIKIE